MDFTNKVVLITGAGSGIGKAIAFNFAKLSANLSLIDINKEHLKKVSEECENVGSSKVYKVIADVSDSEKVKDAVNATEQVYGKIDVVINCAGISRLSNITNPNLLKTLDDVIKVNLISVIAVTHYSAEALIKSKGCTINIASILATNVEKYLLPYIVSKAGVAHFTRCVALELAENGVRVNSISPGPVNTNISINIIKNQEAKEKYYKTVSERIPLKRLVKVEDIAELAIYLASDKASSITGSDFVIDCGASLQNNNDVVTKQLE